MSENYGIESPEYVLQVLNRWYSQRIKNSYTQDDSNKLGIAAIGILDSLEGVSFEEKNRLRPDLLKRCSIESQVAEAGSYFSRAYATLEAFQEGFEINGQRLSDVPEGVRQEYLEDTLRAYGPMQRFVNLVRAKSKNKFPEDLEFKDIDESFIETFGNCDNFIDFSILLLDSGRVLLDYAIATGKISKKAYAYMDKFVDVLKPFHRRFLRKAFGDLESRISLN